VRNLRILFLSRWFPFPPDNGSKIRIFNLLRHLSERHDIDLISFASENISAERFREAKKYCGNVIAVKYHDFDPFHWKALLGFFSNKPRSMVFVYDQSMQKRIDSMIAQNEYEVILASQLDLLSYTEKIKNGKKILEELELTPFYEQIVREKTALGKLRRRLAWRKLTNYIKVATKNFSGITVVSEKEKDLVARVTGCSIPIQVVHNTVDLEANFEYEDVKKTTFPGLIFNGALSFYVNHDAMKYFVREIFPIVQDTIADVKLFITGGLSGVDLSEFPKNEGVVFTGYLENIQKAVAESWICVVPIRLGGGTRLKILEALSLQTPVVSTSKGVEGLELIPGKDLLVGDSPQDFAKHIIRLILDEELRNKMAKSGYDAVKEKYDWRSGGAALEDFICGIVKEKCQ